jgi:hypothetical protein
MKKREGMGGRMLSMITREKKLHKNSMSGILRTGVIVFRRAPFPRGHQFTVLPAISLKKSACYSIDKIASGSMD